jgi:uncharacterized membrane protein YbhN (UPF0104 family)
LPALALAAIASVVQALALATRLWTVFPKGDGTRPSWARIARAYGFGQLTNACVPARAGDVVKVVAMRDERASSAIDATGAVLADKALDVVTVGLLAVVLAPALLVGGMVAVLHVGWIAAIVLLALAVGVGALGRLRPTLFANVRRDVAATWRSLRSVATPRRLVTGLALGSVGWLAEAGAVMSLAHPLGLPLSLGQAVGGLLVLNLGIAIPVSVANVGAYEAAAVVGLRAFGATVSQGLAIGLLNHVLQLATISVFAFVFWVRDRVAARRVPIVDVEFLPMT